MVAVVAMRNSIPYTVAIPTDSYGSYYWGRTSLTGRNRMNQFNNLVSCADEIHIISKIPGARANFQRNDWMVAKSDFAVVYDAGSSGTRHAVAGLNKAGIKFKVFHF